MIDLKEKICFACLRLKNIDEFSKHNCSCDGHRKRCIECSRNNVKIDPEKIKHLKKMCTECETLFYINNDNFAYNKKAQDGYDGICKECHNKTYIKVEVKIPEKNFVELSDFESGVRVCKRCNCIHRTTSKTTGAICEKCKIKNKNNHKS